MSMQLVDAKSGKALKTSEAKAGTRADLGKAVDALLVGVLGPKPVAKKPVKKGKKVKVQIATAKPGATVFLGKVKLKGVTPLTVALKPGRYTIRLEQKGFKTLTDKLKVQPSGENKANYDLVADAPPKPVDEPVDVAAPTPSPTAEDDAPVYEQWWFWTVIGVAVVGGVAAGLAVGLSDDSPAPTGVLNFGINAPDADPRVRAAR